MNQKRVMTRRVSARSERNSPGGMGGARTEIGRGIITYLVYHVPIFAMNPFLGQKSVF